MACRAGIDRIQLPSFRTSGKETGSSSLLVKLWRKFLYSNTYGPWPFSGDRAGQHFETKMFAQMSSPKVILLAKSFKHWYDPSAS
jgi:hypothetical protein